MEHTLFLKLKKVLRDDHSKKIRGKEMKVKSA